VLFFVGCAPVYTKPAINAPLFERAGDIQAAAQIGTHGVDIQGAAAVTDYLGVIAGGSNDSEGDNRHNSVEAGIGYYERFGAGGNGSFAVFGGGGLGDSRGEGEFLSTREEAAGDFVLGFVQGDIGIASEFADVGVSGRVTYLRYDFDVGGTGIAKVVFFEPGAFARVGSRYIKAEAQLGLVLADADDQIDWVPIHISIGLRVNIGEFFADVDRQPTLVQPPTQTPQ